MLDKTPFVSKELVSHLKEIYTTQYLLDMSNQLQNSDQLIGAMSGVILVIDYLNALANEDDE